MLIEQRVRALLAQHLGVPRCKLAPRARLMSDLGANAADVIEIAIELEQAFNFTISEADLLQLIDVDSVVRYVQRRVLN